MRTNPDHISLLQASEELGYHRGQQALIKAAELWCEKPHESSAFSVEQNIKQGQVKTANQLLEYLKNG